MKRHGQLYDRLVSWPNLLDAVHKAARGKRSRDNVARFLFDYERELLRLQEELTQHTYQTGRYRTFTIYEPKTRLISAAPFRDRVVHHALCNVVEPIFERSFIDDSYACRCGKGTHAAVERCQLFMRRFGFVLKADIRKFFPSIDHEILKQRIARKIKDPDILWLAGRIIDGSNPQTPVLDWFPGDDLFTPAERRRGLPIGNQTSQFFANVYLDPLDHFVKDHLHLPGYVRYVDDFLVFSNDKRRLNQLRGEISTFLAGSRLRLHENKSVVFPTTEAVRFLGYRVFRTHRLLVKDNVKRFRRRMRQMQREYATGLLTAEKLTERVRSWIGHAAQADTYRLRSRLFTEVCFRAMAQSQVNDV